MSETDELPEGFDKTNYSDSNFETWRLPKADGSLLLRPLPAMKSRRGKKGIGLFWKLHFGWKGQDETGKERHRPILCIEEKSYGKVVQDCPLCKLVQKRLDKVKAIEVKGKAQNRSDAEIKKAIAPYKEWAGAHRSSGKTRIPCYNKQGQVGIFEAPYGVSKALTDLCRQLQQQGHDPTGAKGLFFNFVRTGQASPKSDSVAVNRIKKVVDGEELEKLDFSVLTKEIAKVALDNLPDLEDSMNRNRYSEAQLLELAELTEASNGSCDPLEVDRILGIHKKDLDSDSDFEEKSEPSNVEDDDFKEEPKAKEEPKPETPKPPKPETKAKPPAEDLADDEDPQDLDDVFGS